MSPKKHDDEFEHDVKLDIEARVRQGVKAVLEEVLQEEMTQHLDAGYRELTPTRRGERNGHYTRNLSSSKANSAQFGPVLLRLQHAVGA